MDISRQRNRCNLSFDLRPLKQELDKTAYVLLCLRLSENSIESSTLLKELNQPHFASQPQEPEMFGHLGLGRPVHLI
jgi:hypothetical protein